MLCPRCDGNSLIPQPTSNPEAQVDRCRRCGGLWFGKGSLTLVLNVAVQELKVLDDAVPGDLPCPGCGKPLYRFKYPQTLVTADMCRHCEGVWFDSGELREVKAVRSHLLASGELVTHAPVTGVKGAVLRFIDTAIGSLTGRSDGL